MLSADGVDRDVDERPQEQGRSWCRPREDVYVVQYGGEPGFHAPRRWDA